VFLVNSRLSQLLAAPSPLCMAEKLLGHPFFRRYGVNLPSSLTEGRSFTWGAFPLPTGVGLRYGQSLFSLEAFLGGLGADDFRVTAHARSCGHAQVIGICLDHALPTRHPACPLAGFTFPTASPLHSNESLWCRTFHLLSIAYDYDVLGLGPD